MKRAWISSAMLVAGVLLMADDCRAQIKVIDGLAPVLVELTEAEIMPADIDGKPDRAAARTVRLPKSMLSGGTLGGRTWYRLRFRYSPSPERLAIFFRGLHAQLSLTLNERFLGRTGSFDETPPRSWNHMRLFEISPEFLIDGENELWIEAGGAGGWTFAAPLIGPFEQARNRYVTRVVTTAVAPFAVGVMVAALGGFAVVLWAHRRREPLYGYYGFANLLCGLHTIWYALPTSPLPLQLNRILWLGAYMFWVSVLLVFFVRFAGEPWKKFTRVLWFFGISSTPILYLAEQLGQFSSISLAWRAVGLSLVAIALGIAARYAWRKNTTDSNLLFSTGLLALAFGIHDWWTGQTVIGIYTRVPLVPYIGLAFVLLFGWLLATRFSRDADRLEAINASLTERVAEKTRELTDNHERLREAEYQQSTLEERSRILRDMHDGLGTKLMISLRSLERGEIDNQAAAALVRDCIDELRLTVDTYDQADGDLAGLLANLRYRLGDRLKAAGLEVEWKVAETPPIASLERGGRELMRIIQEALNNILKHANASKVTFETALEGDQVRVTLRDNGRGFTPTTRTDGRHGHGLSNMRLRAGQLGATFGIDSGQTGSAIHISLPIGKRS